MGDIHLFIRMFLFLWLSNEVEVEYFLFEILRLVMLFLAIK